MAPPGTTRPLFNSYVALAAVVVTLVAIILEVPQPSWNWDTDVLPLARQYSGNDKKKSSAKNFETVPLQGVTAVVTGATSGIGLGLTKVFTRLGAHVVVLGRSPAKLLQLVQDLKEQQPDAKITMFVGDLEDLASVARAADQIASKFPRIDILINNAGLHKGIKMFDRSVTPQGYDLAFGVNYLSHFLLTEKLLPKLLKSSKPRIVQVSSTYHIGVDGSDLIPPSSGARPVASQPGGSVGYYVFRTQRQYANSKLAQILHARALQRRYPAKKGSGNNSTWIRSACPGWVGTNIGGQAGSVFYVLINNFGYSVEGFGVASILQAALSEDKASNSTSNQSPNDFFANTYWTYWFSVTFTKLDWLLGNSLVYQLGIRDFLANMFASVMLFTQKMVPFSGPTPSSPESYDTVAQDQLYQWSREAVAPWL